MDIKGLLFENKGFKQTIFKNTFWLAASQVAIRLLKLALIFYVARMLTVEEFGRFNWALSFVTLFAVFADLGINSISIREFSQKKENEQHMSDLFGLKIFLGFFVFVAIFLYSLFFIQDSDMKIMLWILSLYGVIISFDGLFASFFQAREKMEYIAWADFIQGGITVIFGLIFVFLLPNALSLSWSYFLAALFYTVFFIILFKLQKEKFSVSFNIQTWKKFLKMSWPMALAGIFGVIYTSTDSVMLGWFKQFEAVAYYNAAQKFIWIAIIPAGLIYSSFFPAVNKIIDESKEKFQKAWSFQVEIMFALAIPIVVGIFALAPKIIEFGYGPNYYPAIGALKVLAVMLFFSYIIHPFNQLLVSFHKQESIFWVSSSTALLNVVLNAILIPKYSFYGAGVATVISYFAALVFNVLLCKKYLSVDLLNKNTMMTIFVSSISCIPMFFAVTNQAVYRFNVFIPGIIGVIVYFLFFGLLRTKLLNKFYR
ncbi:MAG TPA: flippase [Candidatus Pacearchaeota archaeon]|nr:flippase [Candidatus Pacearchaeota archaeon]HPM08689.1 flippase [Candidatus Pacearchaeota archaeon]